MLYCPNSGANDISISYQLRWYNRGPYTRAYMRNAAAQRVNGINVVSDLF